MQDSDSKADWQRCDQLNASMVKACYSVKFTRWSEEKMRHHNNSCSTLVFIMKSLAVSCEILSMNNITLIHNQTLAPCYSFASKKVYLDWLLGDLDSSYTHQHAGAYQQRSCLYIHVYLLWATYYHRKKGPATVTAVTFQMIQRE